MKPPRPGEVTLPALPPADAGVVFIGHLETPWREGDCPKNLAEARARGGTFAAVLRPEFRPALLGLRPGDAVVLLYWMAGARRDLVVQAPRHADGLRGTFALRSPARPNPVAMAVVRLLALDTEAGRLTVDALDGFDGTPLIDVKPCLPSVDVP